MRPSEDARTTLVDDFCAHVGNPTCTKTKQRKFTLYRDPLGYYWCKDHRYLGELLKWGHEHDFPQIAFTGQMRYAIGDDSCRREDRQALWEMAIVSGTYDMCLSAYRYIFSEVEEI